MEELQTWWRVPTIAHFCSLFRAAFNLIDFDIEELEEAFIQETSDESDSSLLENLVVRLLSGCHQRHNLNIDNYHKLLHDFVKRHCPNLDGALNETTTFNCLSLKDKVQILHALCDARLDAHDVAEVLKNLEADSLRVEPLGTDAEGRIYWYFYGTRLYREDAEKPQEIEPPKNEKVNKRKERKRRRGRAKKEAENEEEEIIEEVPKPAASDPAWRIVCSTEEEWKQLAEGFRKSKNKNERALHRTLTIDFLPEISRMFTDKEKIAKKRLIEMAPRRTSRRIEFLKQQKEEEDKKTQAAMREATLAKLRSRETEIREDRILDRHMAKEDRARRARMRAERARRCEEGDEVSQSSNFDIQSNNSYDTFEETENRLKSGMLKILEVLLSHPDSWPFKEPVDEQIAPNYYSVIKQPMDLSTIQNRLKAGHYVIVSQFEEDVRLMISNCRKYNGIDSDYTKMAEKIGRAFERAVQRYFPKPVSDEEEDLAVDIDGDESADMKLRINSMGGFRPRRQASLKAIEMLAQVAEDALKRPERRRGMKRKTTRSPSWTSNDESSESSDESPQVNMTIKHATYGAPREEKPGMNKEGKSENTLTNKLNASSILHFKELVQRSLNSQSSTATTNTTVTKITIPMTKTTTSVSVPVKKRVAAYYVTNKDKLLETPSPPTRTVISLLKKPVITPKETPPQSNNGSIAVTGHVSGAPVMVMSPSTQGSAIRVVNGSQVVTSTTTTQSPTQIQYTILPSNVIPLTLRTSNLQTQPQIYYLQQQGNQIILKPQVVTTQLNGTQVNTQLISTGTHKTLVALTPMSNSGSSSSNLPQY